MDLAENGDPNAVEFLRLDDDFRKNVGSMIAIAFATSGADHPRNDPRLERYLIFLSKKSVFYTDRWYSQQYRQGDNSKTTGNDFSLKNAYETMLLEYGHIQEKLKLPKQSEYYYLFYHYLVSCRSLST